MDKKNSIVLPRTLIGPPSLFEELGFKVSDVGVTLPETWTVRESPDVLFDFFDILDSQGRMRGYAYYSVGGGGHTALSPRYRIHREHTVKGDINSPICITVQDHDGTVLFTAGECSPSACDALLSLCEAFLNTHFPAWEDPLAYWD